MAAKKRAYDVIVVGSGATGGWASKVLTEHGLEVLLLDAGSRADRPDRSGNLTQVRDELHGTSVDRQPIQSRCYAFGPHTQRAFVDDCDNPYETPAGEPFTWIRMRAIGGRLLSWGGVALRMSDRQFKAATLDGSGVDWPISYADLRPYYDEVERFIGVCGIEDQLPDIPNGCFIPLQLSKTELRFKHAVESAWPERRVTGLRRVLRIQPAAADSTRQHLAVLQQEALRTITAAERTGKLTLRGSSIVSRIVTNRDGTRAEGVEYLDGQSGSPFIATARVVVLCASTIETTRILLNSKSKPHPDGIGNSHGVLGKYLADHTVLSVMGVRGGTCARQGNIYIPSCRSVDSRNRPFVRAYGIQGTIGSSGARATACQLVSFGEVLPRASNTVTLSEAVKDRWGIPVPRITCRYSESELAMAAEQLQEASKILVAAGYDVLSNPPALEPGSSIHEVGTARMGADRRSSVLNEYNQCWDVPNLFVTDGAAFPSTGFQNPTLTMMALTVRACHYLVKEYGRGAW